MSPFLAACRFGCSLVLGALLGPVYRLCRTLAGKHTALGDLLFLPWLFRGWLIVCFRVCRGDVRTVYFLAMAGGLLLWEETLGPWLQPVCSGFSRFLKKLLGFFLLPWKKFLIFAKILFASGEKWVTIECTEFFHSHKKRGGVSHGRKKHSAEKCESRSSSRIQYP